MGGHHKKKLRAEKAKVKLKDKKLPKGLNVTKTEFKVRKIVIRDQIKESAVANSLLTESSQARHINLKENLTKLKHPASGFRQDALKNLREAIIAGQQISGQLGDFIQAIAAVSLDMERDARRESFKTLSALLSPMPKESIAPFFHIISSYLRCAMTHIQNGIQEDALQLLDVLLQHVPHLVANHSAKIFQNFLEMISRVRAEGDRANRTLVVQLGQSQTSIKWRSKVLQRLQQMLGSLVEYQRGSLQHASKHSLGFKSETRSFNEKEAQHFAVKRSFATALPCGSFEFSSTVVQTAAAQNTATLGIDAAALSGILTATDEANLLRSYITHLMPLLMESWLEVRPQASTRNSQLLLSTDAAISLRIILEIIEHLWSLVSLHEQQVNNEDLSNWFREEHAQVFALNFMNNGFPYQQVPAVPLPKKSKQDTPNTGGQYCLEQNVSLAHLVCCFSAQQTVNFKAVLKYLTKIVTKIKLNCTENYCRLELALRANLERNGLSLLSAYQQETQELLRATTQAFLGNRIPHRDGLSSKILVLLCNIVQNSALFAACGAQEFLQLMQHLPQLLLKPSISEAALIAMSNLGKQKHVVFLQALIKLTAQIIENIQKIQVTGSCNAFEGKRHIMNLFYWTQECNSTWTAAQRAEFCAQVSKHVSDKRIVSYFQFILQA